MALSSACAYVGRHVLYKNPTKIYDNSRLALIYLSLKYSSATSLNEELARHIFDDVDAQPKKKLSSAMKAYLTRAREYDKFMLREKIEYNVGKRHLANMMGEDPDRFTQKDVNAAIEYLFPSGLYDKKARPIMEEPETIFPPKKAAQFDETGRPFHSMFYTSKPNYYEALYNIVEELEKLNKIEDDELNKGLVPNANNQANFIDSEWMNKEKLEKIFLEQLYDRDYDAFVAAAQRVASHPYSAIAKDVLMKYRVIKIKKSQKLVTLEMKYDDQGRPYILVPNCQKTTAFGEVKVIGNGSGKITINGKDISYFERKQHREQVIFPLIFSNMENKVDVEATIEGGGPTGQSGAIRWGIAWALRSFVDEEMVENMRIAGLLTRDWRRRERKKPGQEGARRKFTWKKR